MAAPILVPLPADLAGHGAAAFGAGAQVRAAEVVSDPPAHPDTASPGSASPRELFLVVAEGELGGRSFAVGDLLACGGPAASGDLVVLVPRGHGRPRLGTVQGARLLGDAGEPCHEVRWRVAGRVLSVVRDPQLARALRPRPPSRPPLRAAARAVAPPPPRTGQLSLFGIAA